MESAPKPQEMRPAPSARPQISDQERRAWDQAVALATADEYSVHLKSPERYQSAIATCIEGDGVLIIGDDEDENFRMAQTVGGQDLGLLPRRGKLIDAIKSGCAMASANIHRISYGEWGEPSRLTLRIKVIPEHLVALFTEEAVAKKEPISRSSSPLMYAIQLVGEQHYQAAALTCRPGDAARLLFEPDNPYDSDAIVAVNSDGQTLGYVPRDSWLREAALDEGKGFDAAIKSAAVGSRGFIEIVLNVSRREDPLGERAFVPA
jgi:hypothetical protein